MVFCAIYLRCPWLINENRLLRIGQTRIGVEPSQYRNFICKLFPENPLEDVRTPGAPSVATLLPWSLQCA